MPTETRPVSPSASSAPEPVRRSPRQIAPSMSEPTKNDVPRPPSMPSEKNPLGSSIRFGKLSCGAAVDGHEARTKARTAMNSMTNLRTTNPRGRSNPLAELSIDYLRVHRQMAVPRFGLDGLSGLRHQIRGNAFGGVTLHIDRC